MSAPLKSIRNRLRQQEAFFKGKEIAYRWPIVSTVHTNLTLRTAYR